MPWIALIIRDGQWTWRHRTQGLLHVPDRRVTGPPPGRRVLPRGQFELLEADRRFGPARVDLPAQRLHADAIADGVTRERDHMRRLASLAQPPPPPRPLRAA